MALKTHVAAQYSLTLRAASLDQLPDIDGVGFLSAWPRLVNVKVSEHELDLHRVFKLPPHENGLVV